jgi:anaerobic selenocysteine-containing dehydrogenase
MVSEAMTTQISRRKFIQAAGLTGTALVASGCTINLQTHETIEPFVVPPEEALPGQHVWYATGCRMCPAGCGVIVRTSNGRAKKIEGNPDHPLNQGRSCARGQAAVQLLYDPDRLKNAVQQQGRNSLNFTPIQWEEALTTLTERIQGARPGAVAFFSSLISDSLGAIATRFTRSLGAGDPIFYDNLGAYAGRTTLARAAGQIFGSEPALPIFNVAGADMVFSFGANFLETWLTPVAYGRSFGDMRTRNPQAAGRPPGDRGFLVQFEPRMSATAAVADEWVPITPGTEGVLALALGKMMIELGLGNARNSPVAAAFEGVNAGLAAAMAGISPEKLETLARTFAGYQKPVAIPGGQVAGQTNGVEAVAAILLLNALAGVAGANDGALFMTPVAPDPLLSNVQVASFGDAEKLISRMKAGEVDVLLVHGNPRFDLPVSAGFSEGLARVPFVVSFSSTVDETAAQADYILPDHTALESWGYQYVTPPADRPALTGQQPVVTPLYDTRATTDVLLDVANRLGGAAKAALPWPNTVEFIKEALKPLVGSDAYYDTSSAGKVWAGWRQFGGWWPTGAQLTLPGTPKAPVDPAVPTAEFEGGIEDYPLHLLVYPSTILGDGQAGNAPWLQETPDPMTTASWETWVEINPVTAASLGLAMDEVVKIASPHGEISAIAYLYPAIRPDTVAIPLGRGHAAGGRFAANHGANPAALLGTRTNSAGDLAHAGTLVRIEKLGRSMKLPRIENNLGVDTANEDGQFPG